MNLPISLFLQFLALLLVPGRRGSWLDGIPLNTPLEYALVVTALLNLFYYAFKAYGAPLVDRMTLRPPRSLESAIQRLRSYQGSIFIGLIVLKLLLFASNFYWPPAHFKIDYLPRHPAYPTRALNFDNLFRIGETVQLADRLRWDGRGRYDPWYRNDADLSAATIRMKGRIRLETDAALRIVYSGRVAGNLGDHAFQLSSAGRTERRLTVVPANVEILPIQLDFPADPETFVELQTLKDERWTTLRPLSDTPVWMEGLLRGMGGLVACLTIFLAGLFVLQIVAAGGGSHYLWMLVFLPLMKWGPRSSCFMILLSVAFIGFLFERRRQGRSHYFSWVVMVVLSIGFFFVTRHSLSTVMLRSPGDDPRTQEMYGRMIFKERSLRAGEPVFYYQPGHRYFIALTLLLFGEYNFFPTYLIMALFFALYWLLLAGLQDRLQETWLSYAAVLAALLFLARLPVSRIYFNLSEPLAWILLAVALACAFAPIRFTRRSWPEYDVPSLPVWAPYVIGFCFAGAAVTRPNQVVGLSLFFVLWAVLVYRGTAEQNRRRHLLGAALLTLGVVLLLPLWHNVHYGGRWLFFSQGAQNAATYVLPPKELLNVVQSPEIQARLAAQLKWLFVWLRPNPNYIDWVGIALFRGIQTAFLIGFLMAAARRRWTELAIGLAIVAGFAGVHIIYQVDNYFPRHVIVIYAVMSLFSVIWLSQPKEPASRS